jgi:hypothetical protein
VLTTIDFGVRVTLSRAARGRFLTFALVGCVVCASLLLVLAVFQVKESEKARYYRHGDGDQLGELAAVDTVTVSSYLGRSVTLIQTPSTANSRSLPPGLASPLLPGEVRLSPALAARVDHDPVLARWFPFRRHADLPVESVNAAGEYKAYIGTAAEGHVAGAVEGLVDTYDPEFRKFQQFGFVLFVAVPAIGLLVTSARFGRSARRERLAALRLLGMPSVACRAALAIETGVPVALGAAVAAALALTVRFDHVVLPVVDRWVFGEDARLGAVLVVGTAVALALSALLVGAGTRREPTTGRLRGLVAHGDPTRGWGVLVYGVGVLLIGWAYARALPRDPLRFWGLIAAGAGITGAVTHLGGVVARLVRWNGGPTPWFIAMRKLSADPRSHTRLAGIAAVVAFVIGVSQPASQLIAEPSSTWVSHARRAGASTVAGWASSVPGTSLSLSDPAPAGVRSILREVGLWPSGQGPPVPPLARGLVGTCADLETLADAQLPACDGSLQALRGNGPAAGPSDQQWPGVLDVHGSNGEVVASVNRPLSVVEVPYDEADLANPGPSLPQLLIPPGLLSENARPYTMGLRLRTDADVETWEKTRSWFMASNASAFLENEFEILASSDSTFSWLVLGFGFVAGIALLGVGLTIFEEHKDGREWLALRVLGLSAWNLIGVRIAIAAVSSLVAVVVATVPSVLVTYAYLKVVGDELGSVRPYVSAGAVCVGIVFLSTLFSAALQTRKISTEAMP